MRILLLSATRLILMLVSVISLAQAQRTLSFQGVLTDTSGNAKADGSYSLTFRLYTVSTGGTAIWTEVRSVQVSKGRFSETLGSVTAFSSAVTFSSSSKYWLGIQEASNPEMTPRIQLSSVAYSFRAERSDTATYALNLPAASTLNDNTLLLRSSTDLYHGLGWYGTGKLFAGVNVDGPALFGFSGGVLGTNAGGAQKIALSWNSAGNVGIANTSPTDRLQIGTYGSNAADTYTTISTDGGNLYRAGLKLRHFSDLYGWTIESDERLLYGGTSALLFRNYFNSAAGTINVAFLLDGKVGIGTTTPDTKLQIGSYSSSANDEYLTIATVGGNSYRSGLKLRHFASDNGWNIVSDERGAGPLGLHITVQHGPTPATRVFVADGGNVGIGTTSPDQLLSVNGNASKVGGGSWATFSDRRLKQDINPFSDGLSVLDKIRPVTFRYNGKLGYPTDKTYVGVIAQEIQSTAPYTVDSYATKFSPDDKEETELLRFDGSALTYITINAVKELKAKVVELERLREENKMLAGRLTELEALVKSLAAQKNDNGNRSVVEVR